MKTSFRFQAVTLVILSSILAFEASASLGIGPLEQQVFDTYRLGENLDKCDLTLSQKNIRRILARALDERQGEFDAYFQATKSRTFQSSEINVGPLSLMPRSFDAKPGSEKTATSDGWISNTSGWVDFDKEFQAIKMTRVDARWARLLGLVRATISDDYHRGALGTWMSVSAEGVAQAPKLVTAIQTCLAEKKCDDLQKSESFNAALNLTRNSLNVFGNYRKAATDLEKEHALSTLLDEIKPFVIYFEPVKQRGVRRSDSNTLIVSLDSGDFRGYETDLGQVIEKFWHVGEDSIKIEWMTSTRDEPIFKFFFSPILKSGSQIDYLRRTITLGQGAFESIPAHEVGRALGFRARYFSVWRPELCKYQDESKSDDLLSDGRTGLISATHWESLKKAYPEKP